jgi:hypothetical protein
MIGMNVISRITTPIGKYHYSASIDSPRNIHSIGINIETFLCFLDQHLGGFVIA